MTVERTVPAAPVVIDVCPVEAVTLPDAPRRSPCNSDSLELCFDLDNAWLVDEMIAALYETWRQAKACETAATDSEGDE